VSVQVLAHNRWHPTQMLLGINKDDPQLHDVYRLGLTDGSLTKVYANPGAFFAWLIDTDLSVRAGVAMTGDGGHQIYLRDKQSGDFTPWLTVPFEDTLTTGGVLDFSRDGTTMYFVSSVGADTGRLVAVDLASGEQTVLAGDPAYDIAEVQWDPRTRRPQAVVVAKEREEWVFLDPEFEAEFRPAPSAAGGRRRDRADPYRPRRPDLAGGAGAERRPDRLLPVRPRHRGAETAVSRPPGDRRLSASADGSVCFHRPRRVADTRLHHLSAGSSGAEPAGRDRRPWWTVGP
jgi:hypothetical protein